MDIRVERKGYNTVLIEWDETARVRLFKKTNEADEPVMLAETESGIYIDEDEHIHANNPLYYIDLNGESSREVRMDSRGDNYQYHIADNYQWQLKTLPRGFAVQAYLKRANSTFCPECYNETLKKRMKTICGTCDGSGTIGAFRGPIAVYIAISQRKKEKIYDDMKEREEESIHCWCGNVPYFKQGDVLIFNGLLYVVHYIPSYIYSPSESVNDPFLVRQEFILMRLDRNNELYDKLLPQ